MIWSELRDSIDTYPWLYALLGLVLSSWLVFLVRTILRWRRGRPSNRGAPLGPRLVRVLRDALAQASLFRNPLAGTMHLLISVGGIGIAVCSFFTHYRYANGPAMDRGGTVHWLFDLFSAMLLSGLLLSTFRRVRRQVRTRLEDGLLLALFFLFTIGAILGHALFTALGDPGWEKGTLYARALGKSFTAMRTATLTSLYGWVWAVTHTALFGLMATLPLTKLRHILISPVSVWMHDVGRPGQLDPVDLEREEGTIGPRRLADLTRKELVDLDACTRCGRCTAVCPATAAGAPLDPMTVLISLADESRGLIRSKEPLSPLAERVGKGALWACTTCMACDDICPVAIEPMRHLVDLRRERVLDGASFPVALQTVYRHLERLGNPWGFPERDRTSWASGLDVPALAAEESTDVLLWVGCMTAYDAQRQRAARDLIQVLRTAGVEFATLGNEERCCGDPARRTGNEYLWRVLARRNVSTLRSRRFRRLVTLCPHGFNTLRNEYPAVGGSFKVMHAAALVAELISQGRLQFARQQVTGGGDLRVTYQDPCYLARGNGMVGQRDAVRAMLRPLQGVEWAEMETHGRETRCCGGGGGQIWLDRSDGRRMEEMRAADVVAAQAQVCITACPFCAAMLSDGLAAAGSDVRVQDWVEWIAERIG